MFSELTNERIKIKGEKKPYDSLPDELSSEITSKSKSLVSIDLSGNSYSAEFFSQFSKVLEQCENLQELNLNDCFVGRKGEIPTSLDSLSIVLIQLKIKKLDLSNNALSISGAQSLSTYLEKATDLESLLIYNCGLGIDGSTIISKAMKGNVKNLKIFAIARNRIESQGAMKISEFFSESSTLKEVYVFQNFIRDDGISAIFNSLVGCSDLTILDVSDNYVKVEASKSLSSLLLATPYLNSLNISDCNIEEEMNKIIVQAISKGEHRWTKIGYNYNELSNNDAIMLLDKLLLTSNETLTVTIPLIPQRIDVKGNDFESKTEKYFTEKLSSANLLHTLSTFEEGDSGDEEDLEKEFSNLKI